MQETARPGRGVNIDPAELRRKRELLGLNQAELAERAKVHYSFISRLEGGRRAKASPRVFARICDALGVLDRTELMADEPAGHAS